MPSIRPLHSLRLCAVLCAAIAVVVLGFVHARGSAPLSPAMLEYVAMGGALSDICGSGDADSLVDDDCPVCRIADAAFPVPTSRLVGCHGMVRKERFVAPACRFVPTPPCRAPPARAPPEIV